MSALKAGAEGEADELEVWKTLQRLVKTQGAMPGVDTSDDLPERLAEPLEPWLGVGLKGAQRVQKKLLKKITKTIKQIKRGTYVREDEEEGGLALTAHHIDLTKLKPGEVLEDPFGDDP